MAVLVIRLRKCTLKSLPYLRSCYFRLDKDYKAYLMHPTHIISTSTQKVSEKENTYLPIASMVKTCNYKTYLMHPTHIISTSTQKVSEKENTYLPIASMVKICNYKAYLIHPQSMYNTYPE